MKRKSSEENLVDVLVEKKNALSGVCSSSIRLPNAKPAKVQTENKVLKKIFRNTSITLISPFNEKCFCLKTFSAISWLSVKNFAFVSSGFKMPRELSWNQNCFMVTWLVIIYACLHILHPLRKKLHEEVVDYFTGRLLTRLRLTINLISFFCTQFQLFALKKIQLSALFGINWRALSQRACWNFCMYIIIHEIGLRTRPGWFY